MVLTPLTHPEILRAPGRAGHGSLVLIADAKFPASTARGPNAELGRSLPEARDAVLGGLDEQGRKRTRARQAILKIKDLISSGEFTAGAPLPTERELTQ